MPGVTLCSVTLLACRSQRLRSAVKRVMLTGAVSGLSKPSVVTYTPSASSSVVSDAVCSHHEHTQCCLELPRCYSLQSAQRQSKHSVSIRCQGDSREWTQSN